MDQRAPVARAERDSLGCTCGDRRYNRPSTPSFAHHRASFRELTAYTRRKTRIKGTEEGQKRRQTGERVRKGTRERGRDERARVQKEKKGKGREKRSEEEKSLRSLS